MTERGNPYDNSFFEPFQKLTSKDIANISEAAKSFAKSPVPNEIVEISRNIKALTDTTTQIYKAIRPDLLKAIGVGVQFANEFDKLMFSQYVMEQDAIEKWNNLEKELKENNRFFPNSDFLSIFDKCTTQANYVFKKGTPIYRARKIDEKDLSDKVNNILKKANSCYTSYEYRTSFATDQDIWDYIKNIPSDEWEDEYSNVLDLQKINFWGFDADKSDAPNPNTTQGRVNPVGISCLYTSNNTRTAISEIQPTVGQIISVAKIKTLKDLNLFNFNFYAAFMNSPLFEKPLEEIKEETGYSFVEIKIFFHTLSDLFTKPSLGHSENYYVTQYISEYIKKLGFEGIMFDSSLIEYGSNIVLFDISRDKNNKPINYKIINSSLHKIDNVKVSSKQIFPKKKTNHR